MEMKIEINLLVVPLALKKQKLRNKTGFMKIMKVLKTHMWMLKAFIQTS